MESGDSTKAERCGSSKDTFKIRLMNIIKIILEFLGFSKQIAENQGQKIPMKKAEIEQRSENKAGELKEDGVKDDWIPKVEFYSRCLSILGEKHARNQVSKLLDCDCVITSIGLERDASNRIFLFIHYTEKDCTTYYKVEVNQKKALRFYF